MKIFLLTRKEETDWDEYAGKVVVAKNEENARKIANTSTADEGLIWEDPEKVTCNIVDTEFEHIVLEDFKAG